MEDTKQLVTLQETIELLGYDIDHNHVGDKYFLQRSQYCFISKLPKANIPQQVTCEPCEDNYYYKVEVDGINYYIPESISMIMDECIPEEYLNVQKERSDKYQDITEDYIKEVKENFDIDLRRNESPQYEGEDYEFTVEVVDPTVKEKDRYNPYIKRRG